MTKRKKQIRVSKPKPKAPEPVEVERTTKEFNSALDTLGLTVASKPTSKALGLSVRHIQRIASGEAPVPEPVAILLDIYLKRGLRDAPKHIRKER